MNAAPYSISYTFRFGGDKTERFNILLDPRTLTLISPKPKTNPPWSRLGYKQCRCCPLTATGNRYCPVAVNISAIVAPFKNIISYEKCAVRCVVPERTYFKEATCMEGLASILGIVMATSDCQIMEIFKPMARFHLPFSTLEETMVRSASMYLLRQYFTKNNQGCPDFGLKQLERHYERLQQLNEGILNRIRDLHKDDSDKNAILVFHSLSQVLSFEINTQLQSIEHFFRSQPEKADPVP